MESVPWIESRLWAGTMNSIIQKSPTVMFKLADFIEHSLLTYAMEIR